MYTSLSYISHQPHFTGAGSAAQSEVFSGTVGAGAGTKTQIVTPLRRVPPAARSEQGPRGSARGDGCLHPAETARVSTPGAAGGLPRVGGLGEQGLGGRPTRGPPRGAGWARGGRGGGVAGGGAAAGGGRVRSWAQGPPWPPRSLAASRERRGAEGLTGRRGRAEQVQPFPGIPGPGALRPRSR